MKSVPSRLVVPRFGPEPSPLCGNSPRFANERRLKKRASVTPPVARNCHACHAFYRVRSAASFPRYRLCGITGPYGKTAHSNGRRREDRSPRNDAAGPHDRVSGTDRSLRAADHGLGRRRSRRGPRRRRAVDRRVGRRLPPRPVARHPRRHQGHRRRRRPANAAGSTLTSPLPCSADATIVKRLRSAGAVILGKTVTTEFACFDPPPTRNPWNAAHTPGGSSSGSAAAVALAMCFGAIASQTGGSITRPASYCGVAGCKPTFGRVSRAGVVPVSFHLDHVGVMARTAADCALLLAAIAGDDPCDPASSREPVSSCPKRSAH